MVAIPQQYPEPGYSRPLNEVQKILSDCLLARLWSPDVDWFQRYNYLREYLGIDVQDEEAVPIIGVGVGGTENEPCIDILSNFPSVPDMDRLFEKLNLAPVPYRVTSSTLPNSCGRPAKGGDELGHPVGDVGTMGCLVEDGFGQQFILSCNHVIANLNAGRRCIDETWEPGRSNKRIGVLHDFKSITFGGSTGNVIDAAISKADQANDVNSGIRQLGHLNGVLDPVPLETDVRKVGKQTSLTHGTVNIKDLSVIVRFQNKQKALFEKQIAVTGTGVGHPFAAGGDSGSLIVDNNNQAVALLFATDAANNLTYGNPISMVLGYFGVKLCV